MTTPTAPALIERSNRLGADPKNTEEDLGLFYANRTILKLEVVPEDVAGGVDVLTGPGLSRTTGLHVPVGSGATAAFLR